MAKWIYLKYSTLENKVKRVATHVEGLTGHTRVTTFRDGASLANVLRDNSVVQISGIDARVGDYIPVSMMDNRPFLEANANAFLNGRYLKKVAKIGGSSGWNSHTVEAELYVFLNPPEYSQGLYIGEVTAEEGSYPNNGRHSDGYWYVKDRLANTAPNISGSDMDLGSKTNDFDVDYVVTDTTENDTVKVEIYVNDILKETKSSITLGYKYIYKVVLSDYSLGNHIVKIVATDSHGVTATRIYRFTKSNTAPVITSSMGEVLGEKNTAFTYLYQVYDENKDNINVTVSLNGKEINNITNATQNEDLTITISDEMINGLELGNTNTITIRADDGKGGITYKRITFVRTNRPPIISGSDRDLGIKSKAFTTSVSATDIEKDEITMQVYIDDTLLKDFGVVEDNKKYDIDVDHDTFIKLSPGKHTVKIVATDSKGSSSERVFTFTRKVGKLDVVFEINEADIRINKILFTPTFSILPNRDKLKVLATNNYYDQAPTWEDITTKALVKQAHAFENAVKTADRWGLAVQVVYEDTESIAILTGMTGGYE